MVIGFPGTENRRFGKVADAPDVVPVEMGQEDVPNLSRGNRQGLQLLRQRLFFPENHRNGPSVKQIGEAGCLPEEMGGIAGVKQEIPRFGMPDQRGQRIKGSRAEGGVPPGHPFELPAVAGAKQLTSHLDFGTTRHTDPLLRRR